MLIINRLLADFIHLLFPDRCAACSAVLLYRERTLCTRCLAVLPNAWEDGMVEELLLRRFCGFVPITHAFALFHFRKGEAVQHLLHQVKYAQRTRVLYHLGRYCGVFWRSKKVHVDMVVPVPLHKKRLQERGYNQSAILAQGLADQLSLPFRPSSLRRTGYTKTQTLYNREERFHNVNGVFAVSEHTHVHNKHVLLVDDLVTTGATLGACAEALVAAGAQHVSLSLLAVAG